jgi:tetratricopeptide (TPR) repeat protein
LNQTQRVSNSAVATLLLVAVAGSAGSATVERTVVYTPTNAAASRLGVRSATRIIKEAAGRSFSNDVKGGWFLPGTDAVVDKGVLTLYTQEKKRKATTFLLHEIDPQLVNLKISRAPDTIGFRTTGNADVIYWRSPKTPDPDLKVSEEKGLTTDSRYPGPTLREVSDAMLVLQSRASLLVGPGYAKRFDEAVVRYRGAAAKPELPEEVRRYMVQAEALVRSQDPDRASCLYVLALDLAPWWATGHYNLALYLAALDEFDGAIIEMKRYLALSPDAPDARAAQDKIYEWEVKVR